MKTKKNQIWNFNNEIDAEVCGEGVKRKILAYADEMMCVENHFEKGAIGALHHHPHTQITYVVSGQFEFTINGEKKIVNGKHVHCAHRYTNDQQRRASRHEHEQIADADSQQARQD